LPSMPGFTLMIILILGVLSCQCLIGVLFLSNSLVAIYIKLFKEF